MLPIPLKAFCGLALLGLAADLAPVPGAVDQVGRLSLDAVLVAGVVALWKALDRKDQQLVAMTSKVTEVMTQVLDAVKELRGSVTELRGSFDALPPCLHTAVGKGKEH